MIGKNEDTGKKKYFGKKEHHIDQKTESGKIIGKNTMGKTLQ